MRYRRTERKDARRGWKMIKVSNEMWGRNFKPGREKSHICKAGFFKTNKVALSTIYPCSGSPRVPKCKYFKACAKENNLKLRGRK